MGFRLGDISDQTESGSIRGIQREIACDCWFTSSGKTIPRLIKVMDEEGFVHTITDIQVLFSEEKTFSGILTVEHVCKIALAGLEKTVKLIYTKENCKWVIVSV